MECMITRCFPKAEFTQALQECPPKMAHLVQFERSRLLELLAPPNGEFREEIYSSLQQILGDNAGKKDNDWRYALELVLMEIRCGKMDAALKQCVQAVQVGLAVFLLELAVFLLELFL